MHKRDKTWTVSISDCIKRLISFGQMSIGARGCDVTTYIISIIAERQCGNKHLKQKQRKKWDSMIKIYLAFVTASEKLDSCLT